MRFCRNCGEELEEETFCPHCGSDLKSAPERVKHGRRVAVYGAIAVAVLVIAVALLPILAPPKHSYEMTFSIESYYVVSSDLTVDNGADSTAEVYFQVTYGGNERLLLIDPDSPGATASSPVNPNKATGKLNTIYPATCNSAVFNVPVGENVIYITVMMRDYDGPTSPTSDYITSREYLRYDDILDIFDDGNTPGSSSQGIKLKIDISNGAKNVSEDIKGNTDPWGAFRYSISFRTT